MSLHNDSRISIALETRLIDDEHERSIRRSQAELRKRLTSLGTQSPVVNDEEIYAHYNICLKMWSENRISEKNAWNLKLIDYMRTMLIKKFQPKETLQVAGISLEASTKIYGVRVDDVHSNTIKLANNMARTDVIQHKDDSQQNTSPQQRTHRKDKRKLQNEKGTVIKDLDALVGGVPKLRSNFFCTSTDTTLVATNLFSSTLIMHYTGYKFMLLSNETFWLDPKQKKSISKKEYTSKIHSLKKIQLCAAFHDFEIDEWNIEDEDRLNFQTTEESVVLYNEEGVPIPELDGTIPNIFENLDDEEPVNNYEGHKAVREVNMVKYSIDSYSKTMGCFGNKRISRLWAGPSHWKFKCVSRKYSRFSGKAVGIKRRPVKKHIPQPINFLEEGNSINKKKISKRRLISTDADYIKCTLPERFLINNDTNRPLILKPRYICKDDTDILKESFRNVDVRNDESDDTNREQGFHNDVVDSVSVHEVVVHSNQRSSFAENLIDLPETAQNIYIPYASKAKRIDIKKLKRSIWKILTNADHLNDISEQETIKKKKFSEVYEELPKHLNKKCKEALSFPLAFVGLLHLANEKNLHFTNIDRQNDFYINKKNFFD